MTNSNPRDAPAKLVPRLCRSSSRRDERRDILTRDRRKTQLAQHAVEDGYRNRSGRGDLNSDRPPASGVVDQKAAHRTLRSNTALAGTAWEIVIGANRSPLAIRNLEIGRVHHRFLRTCVSTLG